MGIYFFPGMLSKNLTLIPPLEANALSKNFTSLAPFMTFRESTYTTEISFVHGKEMIHKFKKLCFCFKQVQKTLFLFIGLVRLHSMQARHNVFNRDIRISIIQNVKYLRFKRLCIRALFPDRLFFIEGMTFLFYLSKFIRKKMFYHESIYLTIASNLLHFTIRKSRNQIKSFCLIVDYHKHWKHFTIEIRKFVLSKKKIIASKLAVAKRLWKCVYRVWYRLFKYQFRLKLPDYLGYKAMALYPRQGHLAFWKSI